MMMILRMPTVMKWFVPVITFFSLTKTLCYQCNRVNLTCSMKSISSCAVHVHSSTLCCYVESVWMMNNNRTGHDHLRNPLLFPCCSQCSSETPTSVVFELNFKELLNLNLFQGFLWYFVYCQFQIYSYIYGINLSLVFYSSKMESRGMNSHINKMLAS